MSKNLYGLAANSLAGSSVVPTHTSVAGSNWGNNTLGALRTALFAAGTGYTATDPLSVGDTTLGASNKLSWSGRSQMQSSADGYVALYNNAGTGFTGLRFGGTSAASPMVKVSGTTLAARLADDSGDAGLSAGTISLSPSVTPAQGAVTIGDAVHPAIQNYVSGNQHGWQFGRAGVALGGYIAADNTTLAIGNTGTGTIVSISSGANLFLMPNGMAGTSTGNGGNGVYLSTQRGGTGSTPVTQLLSAGYNTVRDHDADHLLLSGGVAFGTNRNGGHVYASGSAPTGSGKAGHTYLGYDGLAARGSVVIGNAALATTATDGFLYTPSGAGAPTGTPTAQGSSVPLYVDTTNNKLWAYLGGAWKGVVLA